MPNDTQHGSYEHRAGKKGCGRKRTGNLWAKLGEKPKRKCSHDICLPVAIC